MEKLFGIPMNSVMYALLALFALAMGPVGYLAWRDRVFLKLGLRNIPRRWGQTVLIVLGIMLSTIIITAAFATGDTLTFSIRSEAVASLGHVDESISSAKASSSDGLGRPPYFSYERFRELQDELADFDDIDGMVPAILETVPAVNTRTSLSESRMSLRGLDPDYMQGFGPFALLSGQSVRLGELGDGEAFISESAADELDAETGDSLTLFLEGGEIPITVAGVLGKETLNSGRPSVYVPLRRAQDLLGRPGEINVIYLSNKGGTISGAARTKDVSRRLRVMFADPSVAAQLKELLSDEEVGQALAEREQGLMGDIQKDMRSLRGELKSEQVSDDLISLLSDEKLSSQVLSAVRQAELTDVERRAATLFEDLEAMRVNELKRQVLDAADMAGSALTSIFIVLGLFSITVGIVLIFLIFVMLAAARRWEMGLARAVGAKRRHLVEMFVFEGTAYDLVAATVGAALGVLVSLLIVATGNYIIGGLADGDFELARHVEPRSVVIAFTLGMIITFVTVAFSAYRVSRLNIVAAIRNLPVPITIRTWGWRRGISEVWSASLRPFKLCGSSVYLLVTLHPLRALGSLLGAAWAVPRFFGVLVHSSFRLLWIPLSLGWLTFLLGLLLATVGIRAGQYTSFTVGASGVIIGVGLMCRWGMSRKQVRPELRDRIAFTFIGLLMLVLWILPMKVLRHLTGDLSVSIEVFFIGGVAVVAAAVWTVMYNADLILRAMTFATSGVSKLRPVLVTAVAYPMSSKFRTGLTVAMFALVIFTLIVMSILLDTNRVVLDQIEEVTGGWDIEATVSYSNPIPDIRQAIRETPGLEEDDFHAIGGVVALPIQARQMGIESQAWKRHMLEMVDAEYLEATGFDFSIIATGYGPTKEDVWRALRDDPSLAVIDSMAVPSRQTPGYMMGHGDWLLLDGVYTEDEEMSPIEIEIREPLTGQVVRITIIAVLDPLVRWFGLTASMAHVAEALPFAVPVTGYLFQTNEGADNAALAKKVEASFLRHGVEATSIEEEIRENQFVGQAFSNLLTGFMALGLVVGFAGLGVVSTRAVVERRQQIGVLRAIGFRRGMIQLSFLLESSFVALLGILIGIGLGTVVAFNVVQDMKDQMEGIRFTIPWFKIGVIVSVAYLFSLATTFLPAREAARIHPAEALRYE